MLRQSMPTFFAFEDGKLKRELSVRSPTLLCFDRLTDGSY